MAKVKSFDRFVSEMKRETLSFEIFGEVYHIPKRIPAIVMLELSRYDEDAEIPVKLLYEAARQIFGEDTLRELAKHAEFTVEVLNELLKWAFQAINGSEEEPMEVTEDDAGGHREKN